MSDFWDLYHQGCQNDHNGVVLRHEIMGMERCRWNATDSAHTLSATTWSNIYYLFWPKYKYNVIYEKIPTLIIIMLHINQLGIRRVAPTCPTECALWRILIYSIRIRIVRCPGSASNTTSSRDVRAPLKPSWIVRGRQERNHKFGKVVIKIKCDWAFIWVLVTLAGTAQYPWVLRQSQYCGCCRWVLQGTAGTAGNVDVYGYCGSSRGYCRVLWVLWVLWNLGTAGTAGGYYRVLQGTAERIEC
jgi:hypothetical protein